MHDSDLSESLKIRTTVCLIFKQIRAVQTQFNKPPAQQFLPTYDSLQHISTVYTVGSLAYLQSRCGTPKHIQIQMKLGHSFLKLFGTDGGFESNNFQEFFFSPFLMNHLNMHDL